MESNPIVGHIKDGVVRNCLVWESFLRVAHFVSKARIIPPPPFRWKIKWEREFFIRCRLDSRQGGEGYKRGTAAKVSHFYLPRGLTKQQQQNNPTGIESNIPLPHPIIIASRRTGGSGSVSPVQEFEPSFFFFFQG